MSFFFLFYLNKNNGAASECFFLIGRELLDLYLCFGLPAVESKIW